MNLLLAHKILRSAEMQPRERLRVHGKDEVWEVHLMAEAGLIEADESNPAEAVITRITHAGRQFYRAFQHAENYLQMRAGQPRPAH